MRFKLPSLKLLSKLSFLKEKLTLHNSIFAIYKGVLNYVTQNYVSCFQRIKLHHFQWGHAKESILVILGAGL